MSLEHQPVMPPRWGSGRVARSPTRALAVSQQDPIRAACVVLGLGDLGDESVEDDLHVRSALAETAQLLRWLQRSNFLICLICG